MCADIRVLRKGEGLRIRLQLQYLRHSHDPNLSQRTRTAARGCASIRTARSSARELEAEDLVEGGVPQAPPPVSCGSSTTAKTPSRELHALGAGDGREGADAGGGATKNVHHERR